MIQHAWQKIRQKDPAALYLLGTALALVAMFWGFIELSGDVLEGDTERLDILLLTMLRREDDLSVPIGPPWLLIAARDITALGGHTVLTMVTLIAAGYTLLIRRFGTMLLILAASLGGMAINSMLKWAFNRPRPDIVPHLVEVSTMSFPSGHALMSAAIYLSLGAILAQLTPYHWQKIYILGTVLLLTCFIGLSRIYLGVHYPSDVLAGWAVGLAWAIICWFAMVFLQQKRLIDSLNT